MPLHPSDPIYVVATTVSLGFVLLLFSLLVPGEPVALLAPVGRDEFEREAEVNDFVSNFSPPPSSIPARVNVEAVPPPIAKYEWTQTPAYDPSVTGGAEAHHIEESAPPTRPSPSWTASAADYREFMPADEDAPVEIEPAHAHEIERSPSTGHTPRISDRELLANALGDAPTPVPPPPPSIAPVSRIAEEREPVAAPVDRQPAPQVRPEREPVNVGKQRKMTWTSLVDDSADELDMVTRLRIIEALGLVGGSWSREILARAYEQELDATVRGAIFLALRDSKSAA